MTGNDMAFVAQHFNMCPSSLASPPDITLCDCTAAIKDALEPLLYICANRAPHD